MIYIFCVTLSIFLSQISPSTGLFHGIRGAVMDSNDQELRDVLVVLHDLGTGEQRQVKSGEAGRFAFACVRDSKYRLTFSFSGFLTQSINMDYRYPQDVNLQVRMNFETTDSDFIWQGHLVVIEILDSARDAHIQ